MTAAAASLLGSRRAVEACQTAAYFAVAVPSMSLTAAEHEAARAAAAMAAAAARGDATHSGSVAPESQLNAATIALRLGDGIPAHGADFVDG